MLLCFTTLFITDIHAKIEQFPAFLAIFRRKEAIIMKSSVLALISIGKIQLLFCTLILEIVDTNYMNS